MEIRNYLIAKSASYIIELVGIIGVISSIQADNMGVIFSSIQADNMGESIGHFIIGSAFYITGRFASDIVERQRQEDSELENKAEEGK